MHTRKMLPTLPSLLSAPEKPYIHRDLSWLQFNERVLDEARESSGNPLLERAKFLAITASNLDEFFMIRLASLGRTIRSRKDDVERLVGIRNAILENVASFGARQLEVLEGIISELDGLNIRVVRNAVEGTPAYALGKLIFDETLLPKLSAPETFEAAHVNQLENLQIGLIFPGGLWFRIPRGLPTIFSGRDPVNNELHFYFLDDLLSTHLGATFGAKGAPGILRLTRDADFTADFEEEDPETIPDIVRTSLGTRDKGAPVRLQYQGEHTDEVLSTLGTMLKLIPGQIIPSSSTLLLHGLWGIVKEIPEGQPGISYPPFKSTLPKAFQTGANIFEKLQQHDYLLHHPYDSFDAFVAFIQAAAADPDVVQIEQTIYRIDATSPVIDSLKAAAKVKRVRVIIELRARFDEFNNLRLADELRKAGVEVAYGFGKLKLHAKVSLVTRQEGDTKRTYTHLSTGNYNATTARQYTDLGVLTANAEMGQDARIFFDAAFDGQVPQGFKHLVSAPARLHRRLLNLIETERQNAQKGEKTHIVAKVNALVDEGVINALYEASRAGVQVDLIVRGACSIIPGVKGLSDNIRVISVVDRFLEHSRIYYFGSSKAMYLSSADWMPRNFFSRLEIAFPILDPKIYNYIENVVIPTYLSDSLKARELTHQGTWKRRARRPGSPPVRSQFIFERLAAGEYHGTPLQ